MADNALATVIAPHPGADDPGPITIYDGTLGDDVIRGMGTDFISGNAGDDRLIGGLYNDTVAGDHGDDVLFGGDGDDNVSGGDGDDRGFGGDGDDILRGDRGNDVLTGGEGADIFVFAPLVGPGGNTDTVTDFEAGVDRIDVSGLADFDPDEFMENIDYVDGKAIIETFFGKIRLLDVAEGSLDKDDFIFVSTLSDL